MKKRIEKMAENKAKLIAAARQAFTEKGFSAASMDTITASVGLTRGALYHNFGDKQGLLAAVVEQIDSEMALKARAAGEKFEDAWEGLLAEGVAYIEMALIPEVQRIVLLDGPAFLGDPSQWPSQDGCLHSTLKKVNQLIENDVLKQVDAEAASRLLNGAALNAALWVASSSEPKDVLPKAISAFKVLSTGLLK
ncbi:TetR/AcrR family transcriptional regulator [Pseudoalteromonas piscicida]|uniref:HTH tetR-type domain-containing protein n=1 Tax=Pseudoalteromonas piscicida TaxID=43662 RepID=A0ABM6NLE4_PSEO7|nr:TetR/AcrR family transcriptional regulator [Pseudoalteromonas piscicida]ATD09725.1 hypothetical protein PPIS_b0594 [Pseudoalteromonas piscicida]WPU31629.1 TetR/AcrR family transcriptional regulator [Pseudoalteromonas piscicida]